MIRVETCRGSFNLDLSQAPWETAKDVVALILAIHDELRACDEDAAELFLRALAYRLRNPWRDLNAED